MVGRDGWNMNTFLANNSLFSLWAMAAMLVLGTVTSWNREKKNITPLKFNSSHLKIDGWKTTFFQNSPFSGAIILVSERVMVETTPR